MKQPELGQKIQELRRKKGLTQEELVERCNLNVRTLQRIESGEVNPRSYTVKIIFDALEYNNDDYLNTDHQLTTFFETNIRGIFKQLQNFHTMKNTKVFFSNYFLSVGIIWFLCAMAILIFRLNFQPKEIILTIILPLAFAIFRQFSKNENKSSEKGKND